MTLVCPSELCGILVLDATRETAESQLFTAFKHYLASLLQQETAPTLEAIEKYFQQDRYETLHQMDGARLRNFIRWIFDKFGFAFAKGSLDGDYQDRARQLLQSPIVQEPEPETDPMDIKLNVILNAVHRLQEQVAYFQKEFDRVVKSITRPVAPASEVSESTRREIETLHGQLDETKKRLNEIEEENRRLQPQSLAIVPRTEQANAAMPLARIHFDDPDVVEPSLNDIKNQPESAYRVGNQIEVYPDESWQGFRRRMGSKPDLLNYVEGLFRVNGVPIGSVNWDDYLNIKQNVHEGIQVHHSGGQWKPVKSLLHPLPIRCAVCGNTATRACAGCKGRFYCASATCPPADWSVHHKQCEHIGGLFQRT